MMADVANQARQSAAPAPKAQGRQSATTSPATVAASSMSEQSTSTTAVAFPATPPARPMLLASASNGPVPALHPSTKVENIGQSRVAMATMAQGRMPLPRDMIWRGGKDALNVSRVASSSFAGTNSPVNTIDRDLRSRWSTANAGKQWLEYDLGDIRNVSAASVVWYSRRNTQLPVVVSVSTDGSSYRDVQQVSLTGKGTRTDRVSFTTCEARYVRLSFGSSSDRMTASVYEIGLFGDSPATAQAQRASAK
jgi:hypothetical protein